MDAGLMRAAAGALALVSGFWLLPARADLLVCQTSEGHFTIRDVPCKAGEREVRRVADSKSRSGAPRRDFAPRAGGAAVVSDTPVQSRNKTLICDLLNGERRDALAQIAGTAPAPAGESPKDNLAKIERQRARVGCD